MADSLATPPRDLGIRRGRGNGQQAPGGNSAGSEDAGQEHRRNTRGGRARGRGRGGRGRGGYAGQDEEHSSTLPVPQELNSGGVDGNIAVSKLSDGKGKLPAADPVEEDVEVCFICASMVIHQALSPCNHRTCHICALRLRALYKTKACAHCRQLSDAVIFTDDTTGRRYEDFKDEDFHTINHNLGIKYHSAETYDDTLVLLRYNCPDADCDVACLGWPDLHRHVKTIHKMWMCDLCTRNKKVFTHEHELFLHNDLRKHERYGDDNPGAIDQTGFKGHPECVFCRLRFYGDDELFVHLREKHERCHICDRRNQAVGNGRATYLHDYSELELHFQTSHFPCPDPECIEKKFVVFGTEIDLKAHQLETHANSFSSQTRREARRFDMGTFDDLHERYQPERGRRDGRGRGRGGGGRGRGRDPNSEPLPPSSAQPISRAELAFQRERAIQSAQSISTRSFGGRLTVAAPPANRPPTANAPRPAEDGFSSSRSLGAGLEPDSNGSSSPAAARTESDAERLRRLRHEDVIERAARMLQNDQSKVAVFRNHISSFRNSKITAAELIEAFFALFDRPTAEVGSLIKELADIFEIPSRQEALRKAWNDWRAINEDYPSLPGSSATPSNSIGASYGSKRVLKLKTSTAQSARSSVGKTGSWGSTSNASLFPSLPLASANRAGAGRVSATPWGGATSSGPVTSAQAGTPRRTPVTAMTATTGSGDGGMSRDAFPALPPAPKPTSAYFSPGSTSSAVLRPRATLPSASAWGSGGGAGSVSVESAQLEGEEEQVKKKGGKKKGQTLLRFG